MFALSSYKNYNNSGYVALMSVVIIGAAAAAIAVSVLLLGLASSRTSLVLAQSSQARALAEGCVEHALQAISDSSNVAPADSSHFNGDSSHFVPGDSSHFSGGGNYSFRLGTCSYEVSSRGGESGVIAATGTVGTVIRKLRVVISSIHPAITVVSWQDVESL